MTVLPRSVRTQVTASVALIVLVVVALTGLAIALRIDHRDRVDVDRQLEARADRVRADADKLLSDGPGAPHGSADEYGELLAGSQSLVRLLSGGEVVAERGGLPAGVIPVPTADGLSTLVIGGQSWRSLVQPLAAVGGDRMQLLQDIEPVHGTGGDPDDDIRRSDIRLADLLVTDDLWTAVPAVARGFHAA